MSTFFDFLLYNLALDHPLPQPGAAHCWRTGNKKGSLKEPFLITAAEDYSSSKLPAALSRSARFC